MNQPLYFGFKWYTLKGYREFQRTPEVEALIREAVERISAEAGDGFEAEVEPRSGRRRTPRGSVRTVDQRGRKAEAENRALTRAIDAGRI